MLTWEQYSSLKYLKIYFSQRSTQYAYTENEIMKYVIDLRRRSFDIKKYSKKRRKKSINKMCHT